MRGQLYVDFVLAIALFMFVYATIFGYIAFFTAGYRQTTDEFSMESKYLSNTFVESAGYPKYWQSYSEVSSLGFAWFNTSIYPNFIDKVKFNAAAAQSCDTLNSKTDVTVHFKIELEMNKTNSSCSGTAPSNARRIDRTVSIYDGMNITGGIFRLYVW